MVVVGGAVTALRTRLARAICGAVFGKENIDNRVCVSGTEAAADAVLAVLAAPTDADVERVALAIANCKVDATYKLGDRARAAIRALVVP